MPAERSPPQSQGFFSFLYSRFWTKVNSERETVGGKTISYGSSTTTSRQKSLHASTLVAQFERKVSLYADNFIIEKFSSTGLFVFC